ncbi:MAG: CRISPR-associated protein Csm6 [Roseburia sp.]|nr:CRISPR-associated protein Csm6 [Roseburia sp.]
MSRKILFSPVGGTDPIKYLRDGSMLHICRHYRPDVVYLYLSHEMMICHQRDNRYVDAIEWLGGYLGHSFEVRIIERSDLVDVQQYDVFYQDFREEIRKIESGMEKGDELLLNMASGTPAMKSALLVIATLAEYRFQPIQVSTPQGRMNSEYEDREHYDNDLNWELNQDNDEAAPNRCTEVHCLNLLKMLKIEAVKKHIRAYDYTAALSVATEIQEDISEEAYRLLQIADARVKLNRPKISKLAAGTSYDIYPIKEGNKQKVFEYALVLQMKIEKEEYADFIRGITPLVVDLMENILQNKCGIALAGCCEAASKAQVMRWNKDKLERKGLLTFLEAEYGGSFHGGPVYSHHMAKIICHESDDAALQQNVREIVRIEGAVRNVAAHDIVSVTDDWFLQKTGKSARGIFEIVKYLMKEAGISAKKEYWKSYDELNGMIEDHLR